MMVSKRQSSSVAKRTRFIAVVEPALWEKVTERAVICSQALSTIADPDYEQDGPELAVTVTTLVPLWSRSTRLLTDYWSLRPRLWSTPAASFCTSFRVRS